MTRLYLIRHAEAEGNLCRRAHGHYDSLITKNGLRQIRALSQRFANEKIDRCYSSDLVRTRTTSQAIWYPRGLEVQLEPRFREVQLGPWEDVPFGQLEYEVPEQMQQFSHAPLEWYLEGAETVRQVADRFLEGLDRVIREVPNGTAAIFSHGFALRSVQQRLFGDGCDPALGHCDNTGVTLLEYENGAYRLVYLNDNSHLSPEISTLARQQWWRERGNTDRNLWFRPAAPERDWYIACRRDAWEALYGPSPDFPAEAFYQEAAQRSARDPETLWDVMLGGRRVGVLQLDLERKQEGGEVSFLYLCPEQRRQGLGIQFLGQAVSVCRRRGRTQLHLSVSEKNTAALGFYRKYGLQQTGTTPGFYGPLLRMTMDIDLRRDLAPEHGGPASWQNLDIS